MSIITRATDTILHFVTCNNNSFASNNENETAWLRYGIEITLSSLLNLFWVLLISLVLKCFLEGIVFLTVFVTVRQFTGGFHANSYFKCNLTLVICYLLILASYFLFQDRITVVFEAYLVALFVVASIIVCPIRNPNKPLASKKQIMILKTLSVCCGATCGIIGIILTQNNNSLGWLIIVTLQLVLLLCIISIIHERRVCK